MAISDNFVKIALCMQRLGVDNPGEMAVSNFEFSHYEEAAGIDNCFFAISKEAMKEIGEISRNIAEIKKVDPDFPLSWMPLSVSRIPGVVLCGYDSDIPYKSAYGKMSVASVEEIDEMTNEIRNAGKPSFYGRLDIGERGVDIVVLGLEEGENSHNIGLSDLENMVENAFAEKSVFSPR